MFFFALGQRSDLLLGDGFIMYKRDPLVTSDATADVMNGRIVLEQPEKLLVPL